ncbi:hypothetical protein BST47_29400 [Mycolicibacterium tusciae]|uniref:Uncharacterized protein n=1 Tax=Mycolicibacterium tusciae TaxID=75922 RepID=A0A1X0JDS7_9MYCO|nr:hypothetical protein BST47_29400 [Mycolicibacterium tusciae]
MLTLLPDLVDFGRTRSTILEADRVGQGFGKVPAGGPAYVPVNHLSDELRNLIMIESSTSYTLRSYELQ